MIINLINDLREKHINEINSSEEVKVAEAKYMEVVEKLKEISNEQQIKLLLDIEEQVIFLVIIQLKYLYRAGLFDGMELYGDIKGAI